MRSLIRRPSPALVIACLALGVSLSGVAYAAVVLPANSVGTPQLKNNAVTSNKVRNGTLMLIDFKAGQRPQGSKGAKGDSGDKGDKGDKGERGDKGEKGLKGDPGPAGLSGLQIVRTVSGPASASGFVSATALCPAGKKLIGGGGFANGVNGKGPYVVSSTPNAAQTGWTVTTVRGPNQTHNSNVVVSAICANSP